MYGFVQYLILYDMTVISLVYFFFVFLLLIYAIYLVNKIITAFQ